MNHIITEKEQAHNTTMLEERVVFFFVFMGIITLTYGFLFLVDFLPEKPGLTVPESEPIANTIPRAEETNHASTTDKKTHVQNALPVSIIFDSLDNKEMTILNPKENSTSALDAALLSGVVRHPDSADFNNTGTIFLLGHSSYLPVVHNKNFQAFNGIQKLAWGDTIRLRSQDIEYVYSVDRVYQAKAADADVAIEHGIAKLTLATCNSFGTKDDRYIVEATLVESHALSV